MDESEIQDIQNENAYLRRTLAELKVKHESLWERLGETNRRLAALSDVMTGEGAEMRFRPGMREEYRAAVVRLVEFWRASRPR